MIPLTQNTLTFLTSFKLKAGHLGFLIINFLARNFNSKFNLLFDAGEHLDSCYSNRSWLDLLVLPVHQKNINTPLSTLFQNLLSLLVLLKQLW
jgi:hypothetical protein